MNRINFHTEFLKKGQNFIIISENGKKITIKLFLKKTKEQYLFNINIINNKNPFDEIRKFIKIFCKIHNISSIRQFTIQSDNNPDNIIYEIVDRLIYRSSLLFICKKWEVIRLLLIAYKKENIDTCPLALLPLDMIKVICSYFTKYDFIDFRKIISKWMS